MLCYNLALCFFASEKQFIPSHTKVLDFCFLISHSVFSLFSIVISDDNSKSEAGALLAICVLTLCFWELFLLK